MLSARAEPEPERHEPFKRWNMMVQEEKQRQEEEKKKQTIHGAEKFNL